MIFSSINKESIDELCNAFDVFLSERNITFTYMRMDEENGLISFTFCNNPEKARSVEFNANNCIGLEVDYIANEVLMPILPRLKAFSKG